MNDRTVSPAHLSDVAIFAAARQALDHCPTIPATIHVHVDERVVTLTGTVQRPSERLDADRAVRPVLGTRRLVNNIVVDPVPSFDGFAPPDDQR